MIREKLLPPVLRLLVGALSCAGEAGRSLAFRLAKWSARVVWRHPRTLPPASRTPFRLPEGLWVHLRAGDVLAEALFRGDPYEVNERALFAKYLRPGDVVLDVGANYGLYTLIAASRVGPRGQVHSFEPAPAEFAKLQANARLNGFRNVMLNPVAVGNSVSEVTLNVYGKGYGAWNSLAQAEVDAPVSQIRVPQVPLDQYAREQRLSRVDFLKIDVEGAELYVFQGADTLLRTLRPPVLCEFADCRTKPFKYTTRDLWDALVRYDYTWWEAGPAGGAPVRVERQAEYGYSNLLAVPAEKTRLLQERIADGRSQ